MRTCPRSPIVSHGCWLAEIWPVSLSAEVVVIPASVSKVPFPSSSGRSALSLVNVFSASQTHYVTINQLLDTREAERPKNTMDSFCQERASQTTFLRKARHMPYADESCEVGGLPSKLNIIGEDTYRCGCCK